MLAEAAKLIELQVLLSQFPLLDRLVKACIIMWTTQYTASAIMYISIHKRYLSILKSCTPPPVDLAYICSLCVLLFLMWCIIPYLWFHYSHQAAILMNAPTLKKGCHICMVYCYPETGPWGRGYLIPRLQWGKEKSIALRLNPSHSTSQRLGDTEAGS